MRVLAMLLPCVVLAQAPQRREGDWVVKTAETMTGGALVMAGNIIVETGGALTLTGVMLTFEERKPQPYRFEARAGATLTITGSAIGGGGSTLLADGAKFTLRKSTVGVLTLRNATGAVLEEIDFSGGAVRLEKSSGAVIRLNRFADASAAGNQGGLTLVESHKNQVTRNSFVRTHATASMSHANEFTDNEVILTGEAPGFIFGGGSGYNVVARNSFVQDESGAAACFAVRVTNTPLRNYILDNTVEGNRYAFLISYSDGTVVAGNRMRGMTDNHTGAIHVVRSRRTQILNNTVADSAGGILLFGGSGNVVRANQVTDSAFGVALVYTDGNTVAGNVLERNADHLSALDSRGNTIEMNTLLGRPGRTRDTSANTWRYNYFEHALGRAAVAVAPAGVDWTPRVAAGRLNPADVPEIEKLTPATPAAPAAINIGQDTLWENCQREAGEINVNAGARLTIRNCTLNAATGWGLSLAVQSGGTLEIVDTTVLDGPNAPLNPVLAAGGKLLIRGSRFRGISGWAGGFALLGDNAVIENNEFSDGYTGLFVGGTRGHRIVNNRFLRNIDGLFGSGEGLTIEGNLFSGNLMSAISLAAGNGRVAGNHFEHGAAGIVAGAAVEVRDNVFAFNGNALWAGVGSTVAGNSFVENGAARLGPGGQGNYWSDYRGPDLDGNGIGDVPYDSTPGVLDRTPLMRAAPRACQPLPGAAEVWIAAAGGTAQVATGVAGECAFKVQAQDEWLSATAGGTVVNLEAAANPAKTYRATTVTVGGRLVRVYQHPAGCTYTLSATKMDAAREAGAVKVTVSAPAGCVWSVTGAPWWSLPEQQALSGVGDGEAVLTLPTNLSEARGATLLVAGQALSLTQAASGPVFLAGSVVNAASGLAPGGLAPGTFVSLYGSRLGPVDGAAAALPEKGLGGTRVFFGETEAYLTYAGWNQANVLLPNGLAPGAPVTLRTEYRQAAGVSLPLNVLPATPGIFTLDGSGFGAAVVVNEDNTFNSPQNPAGRGSVVTFFATGFGVTDPPLEDGKHPQAPVFPKPAAPLFVYAGGREVPAENVLFAGAILTGVLQVNLRLPADAPTGNAVQLTLRLDAAGIGYNSQPGVVLAVK